MEPQELAFLDGCNEQMLEKVLAICNVNSGTGNLKGIQRVSEMLVDWFGQLGADFETVSLPPRESIDSAGQQVAQPLGQALHFIKRPNVRPRVLLCIHMDTVYATNHPFQKCRMLDNGFLNGPGVADAKGGLIVMLYALLALEQSSQADQVGWEVIINPDEELGSPSSNAFLRDRAAQADWGLLFEPTLPDGTLVSWRKGTGNFDFVVRGVSAHSGREFDKGRNAIVGLAQLLQSIDALNTDPKITFNVGRVEGGGPLNMVPDLAIGRINVRINSADRQDWVQSEFDRIAEEVRGDGITVEQYGTFTSPPKQLDARSELLQRHIERCGAALDLEIKWQGTGGASDGNKFAAAGLANIDTLGPRGGDIHSSNEYLIVNSLEERARLTAMILAGLPELPGD